MLKSLNRETPIEKNQILKEKMIDISCIYDQIECKIT